MNKSDLVNEVIDAQQEGFKSSKKEVTEILNSALEIIKAKVNAGDKVSLSGFGTFTKENRKQRNGVNPSTRQKIVIPAKDFGKFKAAESFISKP